MHWYTVTIQFKMGETTFEDTSVILGKTQLDAIGAFWANILRRKPGAIYLASHAE